MKILLFTFLLFTFCPLFVFCQSTIDLDKKNGYKDLTFDKPMDEIIKMSNAKKLPSVSNSQTTSYEIRNSEYKKFGDHIATIYITKYNKDNSFYGFSFYFDKKGKPEYTDLVTLFTSLYGEATTKDNLSYSHRWKGAISEILLVYDYSNDQTIMELTNLDTDSKIKAEKEDKLKKTKTEF